MSLCILGSAVDVGNSVNIVRMQKLMIAVIYNMHIKLDPSCVSFNGVRIKEKKERQARLQFSDAFYCYHCQILE